MEDLKGRTALVTGASTGIGAAVAIAYAARGMRVAVHYNSSTAAAEQVVATIQAAGGEAFALQADVRDSAAIRRVVGEAHDRLGAIDVLVNNAGSLVKRLPIADFDDAVFDEVLHINARSVLAFCREVVPLMRAQGRGGSIVNVSSIAARNGGGPGAYLYAGAKGFVSTATRGLAKELAPDKIRVNAVSPGVIQTPFHDRFSTPQLLESFKAAIPLARIGEPDDCVGAFLYLASEQLSGYVTGQILEVNGGQYMP
ncbi:SDR family NAD(P)-dependent oxidoreductase [Variovorax ginsengisoli]|uniref:SDR family NAD(P)-dependent oxidoreductase n=1 Tax=Variovorax ginsengisoli TaxID=363844 RepID=A0ABT8S2C9_9BURK|nr:SDR family NAD(P)-dependent oxidoreductase [Variovorax ginsengisoli]MDN8613916.1 SDR family NAD(P)-dependent oxidoreductase [Variovorax ginsengisoli]MDO1533086.1 SDR family NAD(P)-dependent oxidoreductase [Variovorax ginsengisoli]